VEHVGRSAQGTIAVSATVSTPYTTYSWWTAWLKVQEQTSRPRGANLSKCRPSSERRIHSDRTRSRPPRGTHSQELRRRDRSPPRVPWHGRKKRSPSVVEVECHPDTPLKVSGTTARPTVLPFSAPFSVEIINAQRYEKVKMPTIDLHDRTADPEEH